jgi:hypothetical protein
MHLKYHHLLSFFHFFWFSFVLVFFFVFLLTLWGKLPANLLITCPRFSPEICTYLSTQFGFLQEIHHIILATWVFENGSLRRINSLVVKKELVNVTIQTIQV